jgi:peroxiredoxin
MENELHPLPPGTPAPPFALPRSSSANVALADASGSPVVLLFYPGDWEPVSRDQLSRAQRFLADFEALQAVLIAIAPDSVWSHLEFSKQLGLRFPLLADVQPHGTVAREYGVWRDADATCGRALFVIDGDGIIRWSRTYPLNVAPGVDTPLDVLQQLRDQTNVSPFRDRERRDARSPYPRRRSSANPR